MAVFRLAPRRRCPALTLGPNCTQLGFLGFCRPFHLNQALKTVKYQYKQITPILLPGATFGVFSAGSKTTLSCAYLWIELLQTRFLGFCRPFHLNRALETEKTPLLADWHGFGVFLAFFRLAPRRRCPSLTLDRIALNSVSWAFAGHFTGIGCWKRKNTSISRLPQFCS